MSPYEDITAVAEVVLALEEPGPYTPEERESFYQAARFFRDWGKMAIEMPEEELEKEGMSKEGAIESSQPILAVALELIRMAVGAPPSVPRDRLQDRVRELGQVAIEGLTVVQMGAMGIETPEGPKEPDGLAFY